MYQYPHLVDGYQNNLNLIKGTIFKPTEAFKIVIRGIWQPYLPEEGRSLGNYDFEACLFTGGSHGHAVLVGYYQRTRAGALESLLSDLETTKPSWEEQVQAMVRHKCYIWSTEFGKALKRSDLVWKGFLFNRQGNMGSMKFDDAKSLECLLV